MQILWVNLLTHGLPGVALAVESPEDDTLDRPPIPKGANVIARSRDSTSESGQVPNICASGIPRVARN